MADFFANEARRRVVSGKHFGGERFRRVIDEIVGNFFKGKQRFHFTAKIGIIIAAFQKKRFTLIGYNVQSLVIDLFNLFQPFGIHKNRRRVPHFTLRPLCLTLV